MFHTELDYYAILKVPRNATKEDITLSYRRLAVQLSPLRDPQYDCEFVPLPCDVNDTHMAPLPKLRQWEYINMAFDVLGNDLLRTIYDRFGEGGLLQGVKLPYGYHPPYQYHGDHMRVYHSVFGSNSPYANIIDAVTNPPVLYNTKDHGIGVRVRDPPVEKLIHLDLEEVRFGSVKLMHVWRQEFVDEQQTHTKKAKVTLTLRIAPGTTPGTRYCFREEGDRGPTKIPADIIFVTADKPHMIFMRRNHHDLVYKHKIDLFKALTGFHFTIQSLDKRKLPVFITDVVHPDYKKILPREGLPKCVVETGAPSMCPRFTEYGDLIIEFEVQYPTYLNRDMKTRTREFFKYLYEEEKKAANEEPDVLKQLRPK